MEIIIYYYRLGLFNTDNKDEAITMAETRNLSRLDWVETSRECLKIAEGILAKDKDKWSIYKEYYRNAPPFPASTA